MLLVVLMWGGNYVASKLAIGFIPPLAFTAIRFAVGSAILWVLIRRENRLWSLPTPALGRVVLLGLVGNTLYQVCFILGLSRTTATNAALILATMPTMVTLTSGLLGLETLTSRQRLAPLLATAGVVAVVTSNGPLTWGDGLGDLLMLGAVACWTAYTLGIRRMSGRLSALQLTGWAMIAGTPGLVLAGIPSLVTLPWRTIPWQAWAGLAYSTGLSLVAAYILWSRAVQKLGASRAALYTCLSPLVAALVAMAILGEQPGPAHLIGGILIAGGVLLGTRPGLGPRAG
jgi:drug/metabolite transporter (DMT)-like permease